MGIRLLITDGYQLGCLDNDFLAIESEIAIIKLCQFHVNPMKNPIMQRLSIESVLFLYWRRLAAYFPFLLGVALGPMAVSEIWAANLKIEELHCECMANPVGLDVAQPRLSWVLKSAERGQKQSAYRIRVASDEQILASNCGDLWDSGRVNSDETAQIAYDGRLLKSCQRVCWNVTVWDQGGHESAVSSTSSWEMGLLKASDWQPAKWIAGGEDKSQSSAPILRQELEINKKIKQARVYICGLGYYELHVNGSKVGDHLLDPAYTDYDRRVFYVTYDVTKLLRKGRNALGVVLGNGWYNMQTEVGWGFQNASWRKSPRLLLQCDVSFSDGTKTNWATDGSWRCSTGPIVYDNIYGGETYDARLEKPGWDVPGYDDSLWRAAQVVEAPTGRLVAQMMPPIKSAQVYKPVAFTEPKPGVYVIDFGQNLSGFAELRARGSAGTQVVMNYGERVGTNGLLDVSDISQFHTLNGVGQQFQTDTYILKGKGLETWHSSFDYDGFQYIEVRGFPGRPNLDSFRAIFVHSAVPEAGEFECSNPIFNNIQKATRRSYLSNLQGYPTDCPQREKSGWTGDAHLAAEQAMYNFMPVPVYEKWLNDLEDLQWTNGELPAIAPTPGFGYSWGNGPAWDSALFLIPSYLYEYYGDRRVFNDHYEAMKLYLDYLTSRATNGVVSIGLGDWVPVKTDTPVELTSTAYYFKDAVITAQAASLLGHPADAKKYNDLATEIKADFNAKFYDARRGVYGNGSQTALSCALYQGLVESSERPGVLSNLLAAVAGSDGHIDTGILGAKYILNALSESGRPDVAYEIAARTNFPGWGWWMQQGATTLWEGWNGGGSRNHIMFGDISAWFYKTLAGINADPAVPGFKHIIIRPNCVEDLTSACAKYDSVCGPIVSDWKIAHGRFKLLVEIPANTTATVYLPDAKVEDVFEGRALAVKARGIIAFRQEQGVAAFEIGSGRYEFTSLMPAIANQRGAATIEK